MNGNTEDKANASLQDAEVIRYFKEVDALPQEDKTALIRVIVGFIRDVKLNRLMLRKTKAAVMRLCCLFSFIIIELFEAGTNYLFYL